MEDRTARFWSFTIFPADLLRAAPQSYEGLMRCGKSGDWLRLSDIQRGAPQFESLWLVISQLDFWVERERKLRKSCAKFCLRAALPFQSGQSAKERERTWGRHYVCSCLR